ncbi:hypothetical protein [Bartonella grahamii]|uniref:hypothetical protein n=1 Tax=Bartonella grahamii TaxID=33045 RepID=UPI0037C61345
MHCVCFCHGMECGEINGGRDCEWMGEVGMKRRVALKKEERVWGIFRLDFLVLSDETVSFEEG